MGNSNLARVAATATGKWGAIALYLCVLAGSLTLNVTLAWKVRGTHGGGTPQGGILRREGTAIPTISTADLDGRPSPVVFAGHQPTVVYVFSPDCAWCQRNADNVGVLYRAVGSAYRFVGLSAPSGQLRRYLSKYGGGLPVYLSTEVDKLTLATPHTFVVSPEGLILKEWSGAYMAGVQAEIEQYFKVRLPGLSLQARDR